MNDNTSWTPFPDDNLLGLTDKNLLNEYEAKGITKAELYVFGLDTEVEISTTLMLDIHKTAFEELYDWAGKWRNVNVTSWTINATRTSTNYSFNVSVYRQFKFQNFSFKDTE